MKNNAIKSMKDQVRRLWESGDQKSAIETVEDRFGAEELEDALNYLGFESRDIVLEDLHGELQHQADALIDPEDDLIDVKKVIDVTVSVQNCDDHIFDVGLGLMYAKPIVVDDFLEAMDTIVNDPDNFQKEEC